MTKKGKEKAMNAAMMAMHRLVKTRTKLISVLFKIYQFSMPINHCRSAFE